MLRFRWAVAVATLPFSQKRTFNDDQLPKFTKKGISLEITDSQQSIMNKISIDCLKNRNMKLYDTPAHRVLLTSIHNKCNALKKGRFEGKNGVQSRFIQGPKGIGKTTILQEYTELCNKYHPEVLPIFMTFDDLKATNKSLSSKPLMECLHEVLMQQYNLVIPNGEGSLEDRISHSLILANKYVLLLIDEVEEVYRTSDNHIHRASRISTLADLKWLGTQKTGRFAVYLCGSSSSCPLLVTCDGSKEEFPLLSDAPHLNGTKYQTLSLPISPFTELKTASRIIQLYPTFADLAEETLEKFSRLVAFGVGIVPRSIDAMLVKLEEEEMDLTSQLMPGAHLSGSKLFYSSISAPLYRRLMRKMDEKNEKMRQLITDDQGEISIELVLSEKWEEVFVPLTYEDVMCVWDEMCCENEFPDKNGDVDMLQRALLDLCDKAQITYTYVQGSMPAGIYPICPAQIYVEPQPNDWVLEFTNTYSIGLRQAFEYLVKEATTQAIQAYIP